MKNSHYAQKQFDEVIPGMPKLQHLTVTIVNHLTCLSNHLIRSFDPGILLPFDDIANGHAPGVPQLLAFYHAAFKHGLKLKSFACKGISWQLFKSPKTDLDILANVLSEAHSIVLHLCAGYAHVRGDTGPLFRDPGVRNAIGICIDCRV